MFGFSGNMTVFLVYKHQNKSVMHERSNCNSHFNNSHPTWTALTTNWDWKIHYRRN